MASPNIVELTDDTFDAEVINSDKPTLVDFWAVWCGPCRQVAPVVATLAEEYKGKLKVAKLDIDHHQRVATQYNIKSIPTLLVFKNGAVVETIIGAVPKSKLEDKIKPHL